VHEYRSIMIEIDSSLRGFLQLFDGMHQDNVKASKSLNSTKQQKRGQKGKEKKYQQRWQRMLGDVTDGVGSYAVELLRLDQLDRPIC
jgi:hypothetical protein